MAISRFWINPSTKWSVTSNTLSLLSEYTNSNLIMGYSELMYSVKEFSAARH